MNRKWKMIHSHSQNQETTFEKEIDNATTTTKNPLTCLHVEKYLQINLHTVNEWNIF